MLPSLKGQLIWRQTEGRGPAGLPWRRWCPHFNKWAGWGLSCSCGHPSLLRPSASIVMGEERDQTPLSTLGGSNLKDRLLCCIIESNRFNDRSNLKGPKGQTVVLYYWKYQPSNSNTDNSDLFLLWHSKKASVTLPQHVLHPSTLSPNENKPFLFLAVGQALWFSTSSCVNKHAGPGLHLDTDNPLAPFWWCQRSLMGSQGLLMPD